MLVDVITLSGFLLTNAGVAVGIYRYFDGRIKESEDCQDKKVARVYQRLDENKKDLDDKFVRKDVCDILHKETANNLSGLEARIEKRFDKLETLITKLLSDPQ